MCSASFRLEAKPALDRDGAGPGEPHEKRLFELDFEKTLVVIEATLKA